MLSLWRAHLYGWNCSSHTLWTRAWPRSLTCDPCSFGVVVTANSFGRELGEFSYESVCSWGWALACPPMRWTVALLLSRGLDLAPAREHMQASKAQCCCSLQLQGLWNFTDVGLRHGEMCLSAASVFIQSFSCPCIFPPIYSVAAQ